MRNNHPNSSREHRSRDASAGGTRKLCLDQIYDSTDPAVQEFTRQACLEELSGASPKNFFQAYDRAVMRVAHQFSHLLPPDQQALLHQKPIMGGFATAM